jgi:hypothetical protein
MGQLSDPRLSLPSAPSPALLRTASHSRWACWLLGGRRAACEAAATLRRCGSRAEPNVADQPQPLLRSEVQARWRSVVAAQTAVPPKWTAYQCPLGNLDVVDFDVWHRVRFEDIDIGFGPL